MLLEKVEQVLTTNLNVIIREVEKDWVCDLDYQISIGEIGLERNSFLVTNTFVEIDNKPFTTSSSHKLYGLSEYSRKNPPLVVACGNEDKQIKIGFINKHKYLHLPDFLATQLLHITQKTGGKIIAVEPKILLDFKNKIKVYTHFGMVSTPYYFFDYEFEYSEKAELLAKIVGLTDIYKRNLINKNSTLKYIYFLYPYVSLIVYKKTRTTLYPSYVSLIVYNVFNSLKNEVMKEVKEYIDDTESKLLALIKDFNKTNKTIVE
jgi:hypothetical protein